LWEKKKQGVNYHMGERRERNDTRVKAKKKKPVPEGIANSGTWKKNPTEMEKKWTLMGKKKKTR